MGYGPGVACFVVFGIMAAYSGALLWHMFLKLDSDRFPLRSFGDLGYRIYGSWFRICTPHILLQARYIEDLAASVQCFAELATYF